MTLVRLTIRELRQRPGRALLTLASIAIGMAAIVSVSLGTATTRAAYQRMYEEMAGGAALEVTAEGGGTFSEDLAATVRKIDGVEAAVAGVQRRTVLHFRQKQFDLLLLGIDPAQDSKTHRYELRQGRLLAGRDDDGAMLEIGFAEGAGIRPGDEIKLMTPRRARPLRTVKVVGLIGSAGMAASGQGGAIVLPLALAQRWFTRPGQVNVIDLVLREGADEGTVGREVEAAVGAGLDVHPPAGRTQVAQETTAMIEQGLRLASYFAVALAAVIIANTFLMNVSERRQQLAILRAVGATRGQVVGMLLWEGLVMGLAGTVLGCLVGAGAGYLLMEAMTRVSVGTPPPVTFSLPAFLVAGVLGPAVAVGAATLPALLTARISPLEALQPVVAKNGHRIPRWLTLTGLVLTSIAGGAMVLSVRGWFPAFVSILILVVFVASLLLLMPWAVGPLARVAAWLLRPVVRFEGHLAYLQVRRLPIRAALTAGLLYMAVSVGIGLGTTIVNTVEKVRFWHRRSVIGDFWVRAALPDMATGRNVELPMKLGDQIRRIPGVANMDAVRVFNIRVADHGVLVMAQDFTAEDLWMDLYHADPSEVKQRLLAGEVVIGTVLARQAGLRAGDTLTLPTRQGPKPFRVAALAVDFFAGGYVVFLRRSVAEQFFGVEGVDAFGVNVAPGSRPAVQAALEKLVRENGLMLQCFDDLNRGLDGIVNGVVGGLWGVLVLGFVVAAFGIANTLMMNVLEQTRELALLRVVAMTRRQVRSMVLAQAGLLGFIGLLLGSLAGTGTAYVISLSMMPVLGYPVDFVFRPLLLAGCCAIGIVLVLLAALLPAERATRLDVLIALQYE